MQRLQTGRFITRQAFYEKGERQKGQYVFDEDYRKAKHPIAVTKPVMTVVMGGENVFLQSAAPGNVTYTSKNPGDLRRSSCVERRVLSADS